MSASEMAPCTLKDAIGFLAGCLSSVDCGVLAADPRGRVFAVNDCAVRACGFGSVEDALRTGREFPDAARPYDSGGAPLSPESWPVARLCRGEKLHGAEVRLTRGNEITVLRFGGAVLREADEQFVLALVRDVTGERELHTRLRRLAAELTQAEHRERRRLAVVLHDDLQQMLAAAKMSLGLLRRRLGDPVSASILDDADRLVSRSVEASRSLAVELSPPVLYEAGLAPAIEVLGRRLQEKHGLSVHVRTGPACDPEEEDVRILAYQSVRELLFNVVKHAETADADIEMEATPDGHVRIRVSDHGRGFDPDASRPDRDAALGFGLYSIRERLAAIGGNMELKSTPGVGTHVTITVPGRRGTCDHAGARGGPSVLAHSGPTRTLGESIRVLIVDDHQILRQGLVGLLADEPDILVVGEAADGASALELCRHLHPEVVLMDLSLPGMGGIETTRCVSAEWPEVRVIGLSMHDESDMAAAMREAGAVDYVTKGGPVEDLVAAIRAARTGMGRP